MKSIPRIVWLVSAVLLVAAVARLPYVYYTAIRIIICGSAILIAMFSFKEDRAAQLWAVLFLLIAALFNPIAPVYLKRATWFYFDLGTSGAFIAHLILVRQRLENKLSEVA
jgi:hypothetical protein